MVKRHLSLLVCAYLAVSAAAIAQTSYVFQLPGLAQTGQLPQMAGFGDNDFSRHAGPAGNASFTGATKVVATPTGSKFYVLAAGGIFEANSTLTTVTPLSAIAGAVTDAVVTPDGRYLFVVASHLYIVRIADDNVAVDPDTGVPTGATPVAVAVSHDSQTAWVLSNSTTGSTVTALDLNALQVASTQVSLLSGATSMVLSPRGLLYVTTAANRLFEIDPVTMSVTTLGQIQVPGLAGPLQFTPDGNNAYFVNRTSCGTCSPFFKLSVQAHAISTWLPSNGNAPPAVDQVLVAGNNRIFGWSSLYTALYDITPSPLGLSVTSMGALPTTSVVAVAVSNESPTSRYLYLLISDHNFYRINLATNGVDQASTLDPALGLILSFVPVPAQSGAASLSLINPSQTVAPSAPVVLIGQLLDSVGRPVFGASASFSADPASGIAVTNPNVTTTSGGWAQTTVTAPALAGNYNVTLTSGGLSSSFALNVNASGSGGNTGGTGTPQMLIFAGDGQLLRQNESTVETRIPLTVQVVDGTGNPLPNIAVAFQVSEGIGTVASRNQANGGVTDASGFARADYASAGLPNGVTVLLSKILVTSIYGSLEFYEVTQDAPVNGLKQPNSSLVTPAQSRRITIPQGGLLPAGIAAFTYANDTGLPIPNVGLRLADTTDLTAPSKVATCVGLSRADQNGVSRCDVQVLPAACSLGTGDFGVFLSVGEYQQYSLTITLTQGTASTMTAVSALNQTGTPGTSFTLVARVFDGCGQPIATSGLAWGFIQGSAPATFASQQTSSDTGGTVTARVVLGSTAGVVQVQLSGPGLAPILFNITNQVSLSGISLVSGGGQSAVVGQAFAQPLVFKVRDAGNNPVQGATVTFAVTTGTASVNPGSVKSDAQGLVQTSVTAGGIAGNIVITATANAFTATASLSSHASGPSLTAASFTNAASGSVGMTPCGFVTVAGSGIAPGIQGVVAAVSFFGAYPYSLGALSITVNGIPVPIQAIANDQFGQRANFQAPCELTGSSATVVVTANGASTIVSNVLVLAVQPGTFTYTGPNNKIYGAVIREVDGTYVTATNPARQGEKCYVVVTGLGQTTPTLVTNSVGTGSQNVNLPMLVFLSGRGLGTLSARYLFGWVGAYLVEFQVPADSPIGFDQSLLVVALVNGGKDFVVGNTVLLPAVAAAQ